MLAGINASLSGGLISLFNRISLFQGLGFVTACYSRAGSSAGGMEAGKYLFMDPPCLGTILELTSIHQIV